MMIHKKMLLVNLQKSKIFKNLQGSRSRELAAAKAPPPSYDPLTSELVLYWTSSFYSSKSVA